MKYKSFIQAFCGFRCLTTTILLRKTSPKMKNDMRAVRKNCILPSWLNYRAEAAGINFSQVLQNALMKELHLTGR